MALSQENFQADCISWNGYKPCVIQKAEDRPDCFGCEQYEAGPALYDINNQPYSPEVLRSAEKLGIVEMGGLGSILRTSAVTRVIHEINPNVDITWFTHERGAELLKYMPGVTPINIESASSDPQRELVDSLDALINFEAAGPAKDIVIHARKVGGFALNAQGKFHGADSHAEYLQRLQIDDDFRLRNQLTMQQVLLRSVGLEDYEAQYDVALETTNYDQAKQILQQAFGNELPDQIIGLNIGTSENGRVRRWPAEYHVALAKQLVDTHPDKGIAILSGPQDDEVRMRAVTGLKHGGANIATLPNDLEIGNFIGVISKLSLLVTSNTFALHAARSQGVRVVTFENPLPPQEMELSIHDIRLGPKLHCGPCYNRCTQPVEGQCMNEISVNEVAESVERLLAS